MAMYGTLHMYTHEQVEITCEHQLNERRPEGYPVLAIGGVSIYPTRERLERIVAVCSAYLAAHPDKADGPEVGYPSGIRCDHCGNPTASLNGHLRCFGCGNSMPLPAGAATGAAVDTGGLLASMISIDEARRDSLEGLL